MLRSALPVTDLILVFDAGAPERILQSVRQFSVAHKIPVDVIKRPLVDYAQVRNTLFEKLVANTSDHGWDPTTSWGLWLQPDERLEFRPAFDKTLLYHDFYDAVSREDGIASTKGLLFRLSIPWLWYGPVQEVLTSRQPGVTGNIIDGVSLIQKPSPSGPNRSRLQEYKWRAALLENFVNTEDAGPRWLYYTGKNYLAAALVSTKAADKAALLDRAGQFFKRRIKIEEGSPEERFMARIHWVEARLRLATVEQEYLADLWINIEEELLAAYNADPFKGEAFLPIIRYYLHARKWPAAHLYASFAKFEYHGKNPLGTRLLEVNERLYSWSYLYYYYLSAARSGRTAEATAAYHELWQLVRTDPAPFRRKDLARFIVSHPAIIHARSWLGRSLARLGRRTRLDRLGKWQLQPLR